MLRLRLIGGLTVEVDGERRDVPQSRRSRSLLAWLALHPGVHSRSKVAATFWPEVLDQSARASLRVTLTELRKALGPAAGGSLLATREALGLSETELSVDVAELERLIAEGRLAEAVDLGAGELLPELDDEWVLDARDRHRERIAELFQLLAAEAQAADDLRATIKWSRRRAELDPLSEEAACDLVRALATAGDHAAALAAYERLRARLRTTLGIVPSPRTRALVQELRAHAEQLPGAEAADVRRGESAARPPPTAALAGTLVTLLFADLVDSAELADALGDEPAKAAVAAHFDALHEVVRASGGGQIEQVDDGLIVAFSSAAQAMESAAGMQRTVADRNRGSAGNRRLNMRVGVHAGDAAAGGGDRRETTAAVAMGLCAAAAPGQVLVSNVVRELVAPHSRRRFSEMGELELKGLSGPVAVSELSWQATARPATLPALVAANERRPFVGREETLESLQRVAGEVLTGSRRLATVSGEPGIGKTRLAARLSALAHEQGMLVLFGRCFEEALAPYQPFVEALRPHLATQSTNDLETAVGPDAQELSRLFPEIRTGDSTSPPYAGAEGEGNRLRLFDALARLLGFAARPGGLLLVLDDLHWADLPSLLLLGHLLRSPDEAMLMVLATYRDSELRPGDPLGELLSDLAREQPLERFELAGLSEPQVRDLTVLSDAPNTLAPVLHAQTGGNPLFVIELLREREAVGRAASAPGEAGGLTVPESVKGLIRRRAARLGEPSERLLRLAAVVGVEFEFDLLERLSELSGEALADALDAASAARLIEEDREAYGRFHFAHPLIREALYEDTSRTRRVLLHRRVGEGIEALHAGALEGHAAALAHHYFEAACGGNRDQAIDWATRAGQAATAKLAYEEAAAHYKRALTLVEDERRRCELLLALAESKFSAGRFAEARSTFRDAAELAERLGLGEELARAAVGSSGRMGYAAARVDVALIDLLESALALLPDADSTLRAQLMVRLADALAFSPDRERAVAFGREAIAMARRVGDKAALADVLNRSFMAVWDADDLEGRLATAHEAVALAAETGATTQLLEADGWLGGFLVELGDIPGVDRLISAVKQLAEKTREPYYLWLAEAPTASRTLADGTLEEAEARAWHALELARIAGHPISLLFWASQIYLVRELQGRVPEVRAAVEAGAEHYAALPLARCLLAKVYSELGLRSDARREFDRLATTDFGELPRDCMWLSSLGLLADVCAYLGDRRRAATLYQLLEPYAKRLIATGIFAAPQGFAARQLGVLATVLGRFAEAERHLQEAALEYSARTDDVPALAQSPLLAQTRLDHARMLLMRDRPGDRDRALALLEQAREPAERLRWNGFLAKCLTVRHEAEGGATSAGVRRPRRRFAELASEAGAGARAAVSTRAQATLARLIRDAGDATLERRFGTALGLRALLTAAAKSFQPKYACGFQGEIQFDLTHVPLAGSARPDESWTLAVGGKRATIRRGTTERPAFTARTSVPNAIRYLCGEINPITALLDGRIETKGDLMLGARLREMLGGAPLFAVLAEGVNASSPTPVGEDAPARGAGRPTSGVAR